MLHDFVFSLNATVPIFLVMIAGYILKQMGMLTEEFTNVANKFNFKVTLPALLLQDLLAADIGRKFDAGYVLFCAVVTSIAFWSIWGLTRIFVKKQEIRGAFVQASFRSSAAILGIAFIQNIYGNSGMAPLMMIGSVPLFNIYSVIVLTFEAQGEGEKTIGSACREIVKNPIILSILAGVLLSLCQVDFPVIIDNTIGNFARMASPLALIALGAGFEGKKALAKIKPTLVASTIKLLILPLLFLPLAIHFGFRDDKLIAILIMLGSPTTVSCYIMAKNMKNDSVLTSSIVMLTTMLSAFTITIFLFVLKYKNYI